MTQPQTQSLTILGANGNIGDVHAYTEASSDGGVTWGPAYLVNNFGSDHPWGLIDGTNPWLNVGPAMSPYGVNQTTLYRIRFNAPSEWVNPQLAFAIKADNAATVWFNDELAVPYFTAQTSAQADAQFAANLQPGLNEFVIEVVDWGGITGLNYRIDIQMESEEPLDVVDVYEPEPLGNIILGGVDTGVQDRVVEDDILLSAVLEEGSAICAASARNHGQYVSCMAKLHNSLLAAGIITEEEKDTLQSIAGQSGIGKPAKSKGK